MASFFSRSVIVYPITVQAIPAVDAVVLPVCVQPSEDVQDLLTSLKIDSLSTTDNVLLAVETEPF